MPRSIQDSTGAKFTKAKPGKHVYALAYSGNTTTAAVTGEVKVRVPVTRLIGSRAHHTRARA